ncbi:MAG: GIY-YIG nuclease family protein [Vicinamibacteria bacterium]
MLKASVGGRRKGRTLRQNSSLSYVSAKAKRYVYVLRSLKDPERHYVGLTRDVGKRINWHNAGQSPHTAEHKPWELVAVMEFQDQSLATRFEKYLKSGSGRAFAKRHLA